MATWTKNGTTITLTSDTLMSDLINDPDIPVVANDTIQMAGHNLIVDIVTCGSADANVPAPADIGVTIANNSGTDCNLEFKDWSGIRLNATLPLTVHPYVDPNNPLPVKFADDFPNPPYPNDLYRTNLTGNARAEIKINGNFPLGGGSAYLPTETRSGNWYAKITAWPTSTTCIFDRDIDIHVGDYIGTKGVDNVSIRITAYNSITRTATLASAPIGRTQKEFCAISTGGVLVNFLSTNTSSLFTKDIKFGTLTVLLVNPYYSSNFFVFNGVNVYGNRLFVGGTGLLYNMIFSIDSTASIDGVFMFTFSRKSNETPGGQVISFGDLIENFSTIDTYMRNHV